MCMYLCIYKCTNINEIGNKNEKNTNKMSATAGLLVAAISKISPTRDATLPTSQQKRSSIITSDPSRAQVNGITELSCRISRSSSQQNLETDSGKSSCSPGLLDYSYENGTGVGDNGAAHSGANTRGGLAEGTLREKRLCATNSNSEAAASDSMSTVSSIGIGTGISCNAEEEMRQKLRFDRLHKFRLILLALDRQRDPHRLLRERLSKIGERRIFRRGSKNENNCNVCSGQIKQVDSNSFVTCYSCNRRICRGANCSIWLAKSGQWECQLCNSSKESLAHTQSWVAEQMSFNHQKLVSPLRARSEIYIPIGDFNESSIHFESVSQVGMNLDVIPAEQKLKIREYVEEVVAKLLGGSLDQIRVNQLSKSETYLPSIINSNATPQSAAILNNSESNHNPNVSMPSEFSEISQMRLRQMIESIIAETLRMPPLNNGSVSEVALNMDTRSNGVTKSLPLGNGNAHFPHHHRTEHYFEPKIYQDLLATAVLNKIADKEGNIRQFSESTPDLSSCNIDPNFNVENQSTSSGSSVEPRSDFSYTDTEKSPKINKVPGRESVLSDYIAAHTVPLPDLSAAVTESEDDGDHASISSSILAEGTWEDNWLFKKKRSSLTASITGSVGMLVPAPKDDVRAQIGDKTTDEISDLSEMGSDTDDSSSKIICAKIDPLNDRILNKHLIGGQNTKVVLDELIETASMISNTSHSTLNEPKYTETRNEHVLEAASKVEALNPSIANSSAQETMLGYSEIERKQNPSPGSIAEREYKKWNNAVEMPNNPYAPEALKRRISGSQERFMDLPNIVPNTEKSPISLIKTDAADDSRSEIDYKRYSRDYYINDDKVSKTSPKHQIVATDGSRPSPNISDEPTADIAINEVNCHTKNTYKSIPLYTDHSDSHWTLSTTPVHRSSSLKFISRRSPSESYYNLTANAISTSTSTYNQAHLPPRSFTSASHYESSDRIHFKDYCGNDSSRNTNRRRNINRHSEYEDTGNLDADNCNDIDNYSDDIRSQRSWRSASAAANYPATLPKRRAHSSLSFYRGGSGASGISLATKTRTLPSSHILSQFEKQLLHKDLKRDSFRAASATTKDFVMNPLYEKDNLNSIATDNVKNSPNAEIAQRGSSEQMDSGVDSCFLNGLSETDVKTSNTSLLF
ncbi:uncharacterized protein LOC118743527 isoform X3 [Rhagoletis pomonella]|uniref:uncharacterized protein LOC118743527 isoform X3 n=1 Tax=Rhagoletis pomonella TaxID=28610 RepID=UPI001787545D|nr:uncharacterized protein LOC118743527 isoform X3 [Rhagoletis pomonella]